MATKSKDWKFRVAEDEDELVKAAVDASDTELQLRRDPQRSQKRIELRPTGGALRAGPAAWRSHRSPGAPGKDAEGLVELFAKPSVIE